MDAATNDSSTKGGNKMTWIEDEIKKLKGDPRFEFEKALLDFEEALACNIKPMPPEFSRAVDKHFWELFDK
jgi:hypothetical protein